MIVIDADTIAGLIRTIVMFAVAVWIVSGIVWLVATWKMSRDQREWRKRWQR